MSQQQFANPGFSLARLAEFEVLVMDVAIATLIGSALVLTNFGYSFSGRAVAAEVKVTPQPMPALSTSALDLGEALTVQCLVSTPLIDRKECAVGGELFLHPELPEFRPPAIEYQPHAIGSNLSDRTLLFQFRF